MFRLTILFLTLHFLAFSKQIDVCKNCTQTNIQSAISVADSGDMVFVKAGTYNEYDITINKPLTLKGEKGTIVDGQKKGYILKIEANHVTVSGLHLKNVGMSFTKDFSAIHVYKAKNFKIENCTLEAVFFGMLIEKSNTGLIKNNVVSGEGTQEITSGNGIHLWHCNNVVVENNHCHNVRDGIYFEFVTDSKVLNNLSNHNLRYGLHFMFSNHDTYNDNTFRENGAGVAVMFSKFIHMERNVFEKNWGTASYGLLLKEIYDAEIINNRFEGNTIAINIEGSTRVNYFNNILKGNGWGVKVAGACYKNVFEHNSFSSNAFDVSYNSKMNDNSFNENYWGDYTGYDLNKDGIGDVPHRPVKLFSYIVNRTPETIVLLRSLFVDIINFSEKVSPVFTPDDLVDEKPLMSFK
ncbi:MAG: nitrous oxide reductase family maturation protein NosD [Flavobacteriales bacterium]|nr:nitrous oxide reductase family maturation protein NosD [Flavobacteriales bacterium]